MSLLHRIAQDPVPYAFRLIVWGVLLLLIAVTVYAQTEFPVACEKGICHMREADLEKLQQIINALVNKIVELQGKTGCT